MITSDTGQGPSLAAAYVRMSTEHQQYSTSNQMDVIREDAKRRWLEIARQARDFMVRHMHAGGGKSAGKVSVSKAISGRASEYALHPVLLDGALQRVGRRADDLALGHVPAALRVDHHLERLERQRARLELGHAPRREAARDEAAHARVLWWVHAEERERRLQQDGVGDPDRPDDDERRHDVGQDLAEHDAARPGAQAVAPFDGQITEICFRLNEVVLEGQLLFVIEAAAAGDTTAKGDLLTGRFRSGDDWFEFTASLAGDQLTLESIGE